MSLTISDEKLFGSAVMPEDDTTTAIGGAIATNRKPCFDDLAGLFQVVSSAAGDTTQSVTAFYRDTVGAAGQETKTLNGLTAVLFAANIDRLLKGTKSATTTGDVAIESQTAVRTGTAQAGALNTITLDAGASGSDNFYQDMVIRITSGTGSGQIRQIKDYRGATKVVTVSWNWATQPDATSVFRISHGMVFDKNPSEITEVRRVFYGAAANAPGGGAKDIFEKLFYKNSSNGLSLLTATVKKLADPSGRVTFGIESALDGSTTNGPGNTRLVAPAGIVFDNADKVVPGTNLSAGSSIGVWLKLSLADGDIALNTSVTMGLSGQSV